jgi:hypothetical protein
VKELGMDDLISEGFGHQDDWEFQLDLIDPFDVAAVRAHITSAPAGHPVLPRVQEWLESCDRFGPDSLRSLARRYGRNLPETGSADFEDTEAALSARVIAATTSWEDALDDIPPGDAATLRLHAAKAPTGHPAIPFIHDFATAWERDALSTA